MKRGKSHKSGPVENSNKQNSAVSVAHITGRYGIVAAIIGGALAFLGSIIIAIVTIKTVNASNPSKPQVSQTTGETQGERRDRSTGSLEEIIHTVLPEPESPHPQAAYRHNANAKQLLDEIIMKPDKEIKPLLDKVFIELEASYRADDEFGETYYFCGVAHYKLGSYYIAINNISRAIDAFSESLYYFNKSERSYIHRSNIYFDRGKTHHAIASIYQNDDPQKVKEYSQKSIDDFNNALNNNYTYPENIHFAMGIIYYEAGEYQQAKDHYTNALKTTNDKYKPTRTEIYFNRSNANFRLGISSFLNGDYENAVQYYEEAINDNHKNFSAHFELGKTYTFQKRWADAARKFEFILEQKPKKFDLKTVEDSLKYATSMME
jgi:tetratricopeptide (TPR) repeat protein